MTAEIVKTLTSTDFLAWLTAGHDMICEARGMPKVKLEAYRTDGAVVTALLRTDSGDIYRVTVEWLSEDSP